MPYSSVWRGVFCWDAWHSPPIAKEPPFERGVFFGSSGRLGFCCPPFLVWLAGNGTGGRKNGGFGAREPLNPRTLESGHNMQVVIVASCQGADSMRGFLYPVPALLLQEKQTTLSGAATASAKKIGKIRRPSRKGDTADPGTRRVVPADAAFCPLLFEAF